MMAAGCRACIRSRSLCEDRKSTRLNSSHSSTSYAAFCLKKKTSLSNGDYDLAARAARFEIRHRLRRFFEHIAPVDHGGHLAGLHQLAEQLHVVLGELCHERSHPLIAERLFFFNDTATTELYTLSLHDALPI